MFELALLPLIASAVTPGKLLEDADRFRLTAGPVEVATQVTLFEGNSAKKTKRYRVLLKPGRRSLVHFLSPEERGQKLLMVDDKFWMIMPRSRRPIRITPMQKLLGEASTGDIATMTWRDGYAGKTLREAMVGGTRCIVLEIRSTSSGMTYDRVVLRLAHDDHRPLSADLYVKSGKLAKTARFQLGMLNGVRRVVSMTLEDRIQRNSRTVIRYLEMKPAQIPDKYFNPAYLARQTR
jgi:hypothetical protein